MVIDPNTLEANLKGGTAENEAVGNFQHVIARLRGRGKSYEDIWASMKEAIVEHLAD